MLFYEDFSIRLLERTDLNWLKNLRENPEINKFLGSFCLLNNDIQEKWFENLQNDKTRCYMVFEKIVDQSNNKNMSPPFKIRNNQNNKY